MSQHRLDALAKQLSTGSGSRRRALHAVVGTLAAAALPALAPPEVEASRAKRKCAKKGGTWLATAEASSPCHCAGTCTSTTAFVFCHRTSGCACVATTEGGGFCASSSGTNGCTTSTECTQGAKCVVIAEHPNGCGAHSCTSKADCQGFGAGFACINQTCQATECANPCR
jgi:hypothetical protein